MCCTSCKVWGAPWATKAPAQGPSSPQLTQCCLVLLCTNQWEVKTVCWVSCKLLCRGPLLLQFYFTLAPAPQADGKQVVFGKVVEGLDILARIGGCAAKLPPLSDSFTPGCQWVLAIVQQQDQVPRTATGKPDVLANAGH